MGAISAPSIAPPVLSTAVVSDVMVFHLSTAFALDISELQSDVKIAIITYVEVVVGSVLCIVTQSDATTAQGMVATNFRKKNVPATNLFHEEINMSQQK